MSYLFYKYDIRWSFVIHKFRHMYIMCITCIRQHFNMNISNIILRILNVQISTIWKRHCSSITHRLTTFHNENFEIIFSVKFYKQHFDFLFNKIGDIIKHIMSYSSSAHIQILELLLAQQLLVLGIINIKIKSLFGIINDINLYILYISKRLYF